VRFTAEELARLGVWDEEDSDQIRHTTLGENPLWDAAFVVGISGVVRSKSNYRRGGRRRSRQRWSQVSEFEERTRRAFEKARPGSWPDPDPALPVNRRPQVVSVCYARAILDTSNLTKSILDAAEGILYANDSVVRGEYSQVERGGKNQLLVCGFAAYTPRPGGDGRAFQIAAELWPHVQAMFSGWEADAESPEGDCGGGVRGGQ